MTAISPRLYASLIGAPFVEDGRGPGYDCVGLAMEFQRRRGLALPAYLSEPEELHRQLAAGGILEEARRLDAAEAGCVVLLRSPSRLAQRHLGVMVDPFRMLHASQDVGSVVLENLNRSIWGRRVLGFYRVGA